MAELLSDIGSSGHHAGVCPVFLFCESVAVEAINRVKHHYRQLSQAGVWVGTGPLQMAPAQDDSASVRDLLASFIYSGRKWDGLPS